MSGRMYSRSRDKQSHSRDRFGAQVKTNRNRSRSFDRSEEIDVQRKDEKGTGEYVGGKHALRKLDNRLERATSDSERSRLFIQRAKVYEEYYRYYDAIHGMYFFIRFHTHKNS